MTKAHKTGTHTADINEKSTGPADTPLPSWRDGATKAAVLSFVERVTAEGGPDEVPPDDRIAVFDNDGTLWCEKPMPIQLDFILRRLVEMAEHDPELRTRHADVDSPHRQPNHDGDRPNDEGSADQPDNDTTSPTSLTSAPSPLTCVQHRFRPIVELIDCRRSAV